MIRHGWLRGAIALVLILSPGCRTRLDETSGTEDARSGGDGGRRCVDEIVARDPNGATALAVDGDVVFWGNSDGRVQRRDAAGATVLASAPGTIGALALDATSVFFTSTGGALSRVPRAGGPVVQVADRLGMPMELAVDDEAAFVLDRGQGIAAGRVVRVEKDGRTRVLLDFLDVPTGMAADARDLYVPAKLALVEMRAISGPLIVVPKAGGAPTIRLTDLRSPSSVALARDEILLIEQVNERRTYPGSLLSLPRAGGPPAEIARIEDALGLDVTIDPAAAGGRSAFWTAYATDRGSLHRTPLDGGGATTVVTSTDGVLFGRVRASDDAVYFTINWLPGRPPPDGTSVRKVCK